MKSKNKQNTLQKSLCFYFQVHQPYRLNLYNFLDVGEQKSYFDEQKNSEIFRKVANKCYLPTNKLMLDLLNTYPEFKISYSLSGVFIDQCEQYGPDVLDSFKALADTGRVEFLCETYYHSLSFLYSKLEFSEQVEKHRKKIIKLFGVKPQTFRNTELIYQNELANFLQHMGFTSVLAEGADRILEWRSPNFVYNIKKCELSENVKDIANLYKISNRKTPKEIKLLLKNYKLSDDIAFRFGNKEWKDHPLTTCKFSKWCQKTEGDTINLFMDYETFGEHQWEHTGIFDFLKHLPEAILRDGMTFRTPSETISTFNSHGEINMHHPVSWADSERDLSAWLGNEIQENALQEVYNIEKILRHKDGSFHKYLTKNQIETWRKLQTSDQFYYMCTKYWADGDVHKYFSPYDSPYDAYIAFMNVLTDFKLTLQ